MLVAIEAYDDMIKYKMFHALLGFIAATAGSPELISKVDEAGKQLFQLLFGKGETRQDLDEEAAARFKEFGDKYAFRIRSDILQQQNIGKRSVAKAVFATPGQENDDETYF